MRKSRGGILRLQFQRVLESKDLPYAFLILMAIITISFVQSCLMFWGHDQGELPSAATLWVGNGWRSNAELMTFLVWYLLFPLSSALFAGSLSDDRANKATYLLAIRSSVKSYVLSGSFCSFIAAFLFTLVVLLISQALSFIAFPVTVSPDSYSVMSDLAPTNQQGFAMLEGQPFSWLLFQNRYLYNLFYCGYDAFFSGAMALGSFTLSLYIRGNRIIALGLPTMILLAVSAVVPQEYNAASFLLPPVYSSALETTVILAPIIPFVISLLALIATLLLKKEVLV